MSWAAIAVWFTIGWAVFMACLSAWNAWNTRGARLDIATSEAHILDAIDQKYVRKAECELSMDVINERCAGRLVCSRKPDTA